MTGIKLLSAGDFAAGDEREEIVLRDPARQVYRRLVLHGGRLLGAVLYGATEAGAWFFDLVQAQDDVSMLRDGLIFGEAFADPAALSAIAASKVPGPALETRKVA